MLRNDLLVWIDLEMTGLNPQYDVILEIAVVVTDNNLDIIAQGPDLIIHQPEEVMNSMQDYVKNMHTLSGLYAQVLSSKISTPDAQDQVLNFLKKYCMPGTALLCGNSVWMDKAFLSMYMPELYNFFHYRILDVSTLKELAKRWYPDQKLNITSKSESHRALEDILESLEEMKHYKKNIFK